MGLLRVGQQWLAARRPSFMVRGCLTEQAHRARATARKPRRVKVSLTMIVRDEEANLPACLESAAGLFDEVIVVDTGSVDRTREVARDFGARVFDFAWVDDFSAARNAAIERATGDYIFWLDADDRIDLPERLRLLSLLDELEGSRAAYVMRCVCNPGDGSELDHVRLFPNRSDVRWSGRVHEHIIQSLRRAGIEVRWTSVSLRHIGYANPNIVINKRSRNLELLNRDHKERPDDPNVLIYLGWIAIAEGDARAALEYLNASLSGTKPREAMRCKLYSLIALGHQMMGDEEEASGVCARGRAEFPNDAELLYREAHVRFHMGDLATAEANWRRILEFGRPDQLWTTVDAGIYGHATRRGLAKIAEERGNFIEAFRLWSEVLVACPGDPVAIAARVRAARGIIGGMFASTMRAIRRFVGVGRYVGLGEYR